MHSLKATSLNGRHATRTAQILLYDRLRVHIRPTTDRCHWRCHRMPRASHWHSIRVRQQDCRSRGGSRQSMSRSTHANLRRAVARAWGPACWQSGQHDLPRGKECLVLCDDRSPSKSSFRHSILRMQSTPTFLFGVCMCVCVCVCVCVVSINIQSSTRELRCITFKSMCHQQRP